MRSEGESKEHADRIPLFRSEALEASKQTFGSPIRAPGTGMRLASGIIIATLVLAAIFLATTSFPRKETVSGSLMPSHGLSPIISQRSGVVLNVHAEEGELVRDGAPIVSISVDSVMQNGESSGTTLSGIAEELTRASIDRKHASGVSLASQEAGIRGRMVATTRQIALLRANFELYKRQLIIAENTERDLETLRADKLISELQFRDAEVRVINARQAAYEVEARIAQLEQDYQQMRHDLNRLRADSESIQAAATFELLSAREKEVNYKLSTEFMLVAQSAGHITWLRAKAGDTVTPGRTLGVIMPEGSELLAELWVPSSAIAFVHVGTDVRLMYEAFPFEKFGVGHAKITKIARSPTAPAELPADLQAVESHYRLLATLDDQKMQAYGKSLELTPGMRLKADLVLENRSLLDWLLDPVLAVKRRN